MVEFTIIISRTIEFPEPLPIPEPAAQLLAVTFEFEILISPTLEYPSPLPHAVPIPEP
jgi:hypothetical protein